MRNRDIVLQQRRLITIFAVNKAITLCLNHIIIPNHHCNYTCYVKSELRSL